jgi:hypothetical protein
MVYARRADEGEGQQQHSGRRPEHTAKVGPVEIAVWKNTGKTASVYHGRQLRKSGGQHRFSHDRDKSVR